MWWHQLVAGNSCSLWPADDPAVTHGRSRHIINTAAADIHTRTIAQCRSGDSDQSAVSPVELWPRLGSDEYYSVAECLARITPSGGCRRWRSWAAWRRRSTCCRRRPGRATAPPSASWRPGSTGAAAGAPWAWPAARRRPSGWRPGGCWTRCSRLATVGAVTHPWPLGTLRHSLQTR